MFEKSRINLTIEIRVTIEFQGSIIRVVAKKSRINVKIGVRVTTEVQGLTEIHETIRIQVPY